MKVKHLTINNFRGFRQAEVEFPDSNLAVFIGVNGQGKSSLLDLVAMFLNQIPVSLIGRDYDDAAYKIYYTDINLQSSKSSNRISLDGQNGQVAELECYAENGEFVSKCGMEILDTYGAFLRSMLVQISRGKEKASLPVLLHYRANRFFDNNYEPSKDAPPYEAPQFAAYENAFSKKITDFNDFVTWFRIEEDKENERIKKERNFDLTNPSLQPVRKAVLTFFSKLNGFSFSDLRVEREMAKARNFAIAGFSSSLVISKNNQDFRLEQLSDGEKMLLMVVCDIARRLSIANPGLPDPLEGRGIVLIDEIELHLHPKWQREVIPALLSTFPNIQCLLSTHSPQVLSRVDSKDIFLLKDGEVLKLSSNPKGLDTNAILEEVMDTPKYPREVDDLVDEMFAFIQQRKFGQAESARRKVAEASPDNPVLQRADSMMERLKILN
jgi:predicted ATP-binding protein involved in virulence